MARVLVLGCTAATPWARDQLARLRAQAGDVTLVGADTPAALASVSFVDETVAFDVHSPAAARDWVRGRTDIDAVLTVQELCVEATAAVADELGLPGNTPAVVRGIRTKDVCRERLRSAGFAQPRVAVCTTRAEAEAFTREHRGPWVVKPRDGFGSTGVTLVHTVAELPAALAAVGNLSASLDKFGVHSSAEPGSFLIETFVAGAEFSAEGVMLGGRPHVLAVTAKRTNTDFIETGHRVAPLTDPALATAADTVARAITAAGVTHGAFHVEFWVTDRGVVLGEVHARPGGDYIHALVEHSRPGLELYRLMIDDLLGRPPAPVPPQTRTARSEFVLLPAGRLRAVEGWAAVTADPSVLAAELWVRPGEDIPPITDNLDRHGVLVTTGDADLLSKLTVTVDEYSALAA